jgi:aarF domain-containing kinase
VLGAPRGLYLNELIESTRHELHWECDYLREATCQTQYKAKLLSRYPEDYYVPKVVPDLSTKHVLCSEFVEGVEIDTLFNESQEVRDRAGSLLLKLCFKELFEINLMQTDPNPANYMFTPFNMNQASY